MKCNHQWMWLIPQINSVHDSVGFFIEILGDNIIKRSVVCSLCGITGHVINSKKSGVRIHKSEYFLNKANEMAKKYNFKIGQVRRKTINS